MAEDMEILSELFRLFITDPAGTRKELMDAAQPEAVGPVSADYQARWLDNIQKDKLRKLIARKQQQQRNLAAKKVTPQDTEQAFIAANHLV
jgi:adenylate kinase